MVPFHFYLRHIVFRGLRSISPLLILFFVLRSCWNLLFPHLRPKSASFFPISGMVSHVSILCSSTIFQPHSSFPYFPSLFSLLRLSSPRWSSHHRRWTSLLDHLRLSQWPSSTPVRSLNPPNAHESVGLPRAPLLRVMACCRSFSSAPLWCAAATSHRGEQGRGDSILVFPNHRRSSARRR